MKPQLKILFGAILIILGIWWYSLVTPLGTGMDNLSALAVLFKGGLGVFVFLIGVFVVWIESDEMRIQRELEQADFEPEDDFEPDDYKTGGEEFGGEESVVEIDDVDYDELVEGTIDEVKDAVESRDLDPELVLEAEKENKDRKTLKQWLEDRRD